MRKVQLEEIVLLDLVKLGVLGYPELHKDLVVFFAGAIPWASCVV